MTATSPRAEFRCRRVQACRVLGIGPTTDQLIEDWGDEFSAGYFAGISRPIVQLVCGNVKVPFTRGVQGIKQILDVVAVGICVVVAIDLLERAVYSDAYRANRAHFLARGGPSFHGYDLDVRGVAPGWIEAAGEIVERRATGSGAWARW